MELSVSSSLSWQELKDILNIQAPQHLSLYFPTIRTAPEKRQNVVRYKNLLGQATTFIKDHTWISNLLDLETDSEFWEIMNDGLVLLSTPTRIFAYKLPVHLPEYQFVGDQFHVLPLFSYLNQNGSFLVLELELNDMRLRLGSHFGEFTEIPLQADIPTNFQEFLSRLQIEPELQHHTMPGGHAGPALFHGHTDPSAIQKEQIRQFFDRFCEATEELFNAYQLPLVVVGVEYLLPIFAASNRYKYLMEDCLGKQPQTLSDEQLRDFAWNCVESWYTQEEQRARLLVPELQGSKLASPFITDIVPLAVEGRIASLFVRDGAIGWGVFDPEKNEVLPHVERQPVSQNLWELAAQKTVLARGNVYTLPPDDPLIPLEEEGIALLRY